MAEAMPEDIAARAKRVGAVSKEFLLGDVRDFLLDRLRHDKNPLPWNQQGESQQQITIESTTRAAERLIDRVVEIVAADGLPANISAEIETFAVKNGLKISLKASRTDDNLLMLNENFGAKVLIVPIATEGYKQADPVKVEKDQKDLLDGEQGTETDPPDQGEPSEQPPAAKPKKGKKKLGKIDPPAPDSDPLEIPPPLRHKSGDDEDDELDGLGDDGPDEE